MGRAAFRALFIGGLVVVGLGAVAVEIPHTFVNGEVANATDVNANFAVLRDAINDISGNPSPTPPVPASVVWSNFDTGDAACARVKGVCTSAEDGSSTPQACSVSSSSGTAQCSEDSGINESAEWTNIDTGNAACAAQGAHCVQSYDTSGNPFACNVSMTAGVASCLLAKVGDAWDVGASWGATGKTGNMACAQEQAHCVEAFDTSGNPILCSLFASAGVARCKGAKLGDTWDKALMWTNTGHQGSIECGKVGAECVGAFYAGPAYGQPSCEQNVGNTNYEAVVLCKTLDGSENWDTFVSYFGRGGNGHIECGLADADCVGSYYHHPGNFDSGTASCHQNVGNSGYDAFIRCKARTASFTWDFQTNWFGAGSNPEMECAQNDGVCISAHYHHATNFDTGAPNCDQNLGNGGYTAFVKCRNRNASDNWDTTTVWTDTARHGTVQCVQVNGECLDVLYHNTGTFDSGINVCTSTTGASGYTSVARCKTATIADDGWNAHALWSNEDKSGAAACGDIGGTCVATYNTSTGATISCGSVHGATSGGVAKCVLP